MKNKNVLILAFFTAIVVTGCTSTPSLEKQLADNPEILFKAIEKNPERFMQAVQVAASSARDKVEAKKREEQAKELAAAINNPLIPEIRKDEAVLGPSDAPITLVTYSDFECPYCSRGSKTVNSLLQKYEGKIRFVYKHLPLSFHPHAKISAQYFEGIKLQNTKLAFDFHDKIFAQQTSLRNGEKFLKEVAKDLGVNMTKLAKDINSKEVLDTIERHQAEAEKFQMQGTPGFILNGIPVRGAYPVEHFVALIEKLKETGKLTI